MTDVIVENENANFVQNDLSVENAENNELSKDTGLMVEDNQSDKNIQSDDAKNENKDTENNIYGSPENFDYSEIKLPDGMTLDEELISEFNPIAKKLNLSNSSANELMNLAVKLSNKNALNFKEAVEQMKISEKNSYLQLLNNDKELNTSDSATYDQYLDVATQGLKAVSTPEFNQFIKEKGLTHHPEFIKVFHKIGAMCKEASIPSSSIPVGTKLSTADILYGTPTEK